jgi:Phosphotransferase enzyme family
VARRLRRLDPRFGFPLFGLPVFVWKLKDFVKPRHYLRIEDRATEKVQCGLDRLRPDALTVIARIQSCRELYVQIQGNELGVHEVDWKVAGLGEFCPVFAGDTIRALIDRQRFFRKELAAPGDMEMFESARHWLESHIPNVDLRLNHGDCSLSNYMYRGTKIAAVVDWEFASIGDPNMDVAYYCALIFRFRSGVSRDEMERERAHFLSLYGARTGRGGETLLFWEIFANFRNGLSWTKPGHALHFSSGYQAYRDRLRELIERRY